MLPDVGAYTLLAECVWPEWADGSGCDTCCANVRTIRVTKCCLGEI